MATTDQYRLVQDEDRYASTRGLFGTNLGPDDEELNSALETWVRNDKTKTWSRMLVERILMKFKIYNPYRGRRRNPDGSKPPSLRKAWAFYEHVTLGRYFVDHKYTRAEPGDPGETELFGAWWTPASVMHEYGIGVSLYFNALLFLAGIFVIAGCINFPNMAFYASEKYNGEVGQSNLPWDLRGSAICSHREWVVCTDCGQHEADYDPDRFARATNDATGEEATLVERVLCEGGANFHRGVFNFITLGFLIFAINVLGIYEMKREVEEDENKQQVTDYSVQVENPPPDATDPEEWKAFFEQFADKGVILCTIALDNGPLVQELSKRRLYQEQLRWLIGATHEEMDWEDMEDIKKRVETFGEGREKELLSWTEILYDYIAKPFLRLAGFLPPKGGALLAAVEECTEKVKKLQQKKYKAIRVYVTFETEAGQQRALKALTVKEIRRFFNEKNVLPPNHLFRGEHLLKVAEPPEPTDVRWLDLQVPLRRKAEQRFIMFALTLALIWATGSLAHWILHTIGPEAYAIFVSVANSTVPAVITSLQNSMEHHDSETGWQASLYRKVTLVRWVNVAILTVIFTDFTSFLGDHPSDLIRAIRGVLISELIFPALIRLMDPVGNMNKHVLAPRSKTQDDMNSYFTGTEYNLGERYTEMTKVVFVCFFYCSVFPAAFFYGALILLVQYYTDKFCLLRLWAAEPLIGAQLAETSRRYFFTGCTVAFAVAASYAYAQFPYDNVCDMNVAEDGYAGTYTAEANHKSLSLERLTVTSDEAVVHCMQRLIQVDGKFKFPVLPTLQEEASGGGWMNPSQEHLVSAYGVTSAVILGLFVASIVVAFAWDVWSTYFRGIYMPPSRDQGIDFSEVEEIFAYVPRVLPSIKFRYPLLVCSIDEMDLELIGWKIPSTTMDLSAEFDRYNVIYDVPYPGQTRKRGEPPTTNTSTSGERPIFAVLKHWKVGDSKDEDATEAGAEKKSDNNYGSMGEHRP